MKGISIARILSGLKEEAYRGVFLRLWLLFVTHRGGCFFDQSFLSFPRFLLHPHLLDVNQVNGLEKNKKN